MFSNSRGLGDAGPCRLQGPTCSERRIRHFRATKSQLLFFLMILTICFCNNYVFGIILFICEFGCPFVLRNYEGPICGPEFLNFSNYSMSVTQLWHDACLSYMQISITDKTVRRESVPIHILCDASSDIHVLIENDLC